MPKVIEITHLDAPELAVYAHLTEAQLRSRLDPAQALFIAESPKVIRLALEAGLEPVSYLMERRHITGDAAPLLAQSPDVPVYTGERELLRSLTGYALTRGVLCALRRPLLPRAEEICRNARRVAVLEGITDTTNVGAIFRSAAALNVDAVLLSPSCCDPLNRRAVRVSMGTVFQVPWTYLGESAADWPEAGLGRLRALGFHTLAMALTDHARSMDDPALPTQEKLAVILGTEGDGLSPTTLAQCDDTVIIPMSHGVDSLNVAAAAAIAFWQLRPR